MTIFNCFLRIIYKNKVIIIIFMGIFLIMMSFAMGSLSSLDTSTQYNDNHIPLSIIDRDNSVLSVALSEYLSTRHNIIDLEDNTDALQDALFFRNVEYILYIPEGFHEKFLSNSEDVTIENVKLPGSFTGIYIDNQINHYLITIKAYMNSGYDLSKALSYTAKDLQINTEVLVSVASDEEVIYSSIFYQLFPYLILSIIMFSLCPALMAMNKKDLLQRMEFSSMKLWKKNLQITFGCIVPSLIVWLLFVGISFVIYDKTAITTTTLLRMVNSFVLLLISISIAFCTGLFVKSQTTLSAVNNIINMGMCFLCGVFVPQDLLGQGVLSVSKFLPVYWYIKNNSLLNEIEVNPSYLENYAVGIAIQLGFAVAIFLVTLVVIRQKKLNPVG